MEQLGVDLSALGFATEVTKSDETSEDTPADDSEVPEDKPTPSPPDAATLAGLDAVIKDCGTVLQRLHSVYAPCEKGHILIEGHRVVVGKAPPQPR